MLHEVSPDLISEEKRGIEKKVYDYYEYIEAVDSYRTVPSQHER